MDSSADVLLKLRDSIRIFASDRNWDQFNTPKNLASTEKMRQIAKTKDLKLSEYGLFKKNKKLEINSEYDIFKILEIPYIEPKLR
jgi:hypothetical protein